MNPEVITGIKQCTPNVTLGYTHIYTSLEEIYPAWVWEVGRNSRVRVESVNDFIVYILIWQILTMDKNLYSDLG